MTAGFTPFAGRRIAVMGLGRAGLPAALRLRDWGAEVACWDDGEARRAEAAAAGLEVRNLADGPFRWDSLLLSPGIPHTLPRVHPAAAAAIAAGAPVLCDVEFLALALAAKGSRAKLVGITGTNGKSTTTALIAHIARHAGLPVQEGGNLGPAALGLDLLDDGLYVIEMSSYMLERIATLRFDVAVMLNLSPDHLDRHGDMAGYAAAKAAIFARQRPGDVAVLGQDDAMTRALAAQVTARLVPISARTPQPGGVWADGPLLRDAAGVIADLTPALTLPGAHNAQNAAAAAAACLALGIARDIIPRALPSYPGLPHRQERVAERHGILYVNDSKATNADSTERALASYDRVVLIAGGMAKEGGIAPLAHLFPRIAHAFLIGRDAAQLAATLAAHGVRHDIVGTLEAAIPAAAAAAEAGAARVVLLSPACASFDQFTGFDARGDRFRDLVRALGRMNGKAA